MLMGDVSYQMKGGWLRQLQARNVSAGLIDIIETCVAPPDQRFADAGALLAALEQETAGAGNTRKLKFCHRCGHQSPRSNRYCNKCGYEFP